MFCHVRRSHCGVQGRQDRVLRQCRQHSSCVADHLALGLPSLSLSLSWLPTFCPTMLVLEGQPCTKVLPNAATQANGSITETDRQTCGPAMSLAQVAGPGNDWVGPIDILGPWKDPWSPSLSWRQSQQSQHNQTNESHHPCDLGCN